LLLLPFRLAECKYRQKWIFFKV